MSLLSDMPHTCDLGRTTATQDESGGAVLQDEDFYATDEPAFVQTASASDIKEFRADGQRVTHMIFLQRNPGLRKGDRLIPRDGASACPYAGVELAIVTFRDCTAGFGLAWEVFCEIYRQVQPS